MDKTLFGARLYDARKRAGLTTEKAELCDCTPAMIRAIEGGVRLPSLPKFVYLCNALKIPPNELLSQEIKFAMDIAAYSDSGQNEYLALKLQQLPEGKRIVVQHTMSYLIDEIEHI